MFKNAIVYRIAPLPADLAQGEPDIEALLARAAFVSCGATQPVSIGWVPPRGLDHGPLVEVVAGQYLFRLMLEQKVLPGDAVKRAVAEACKEIERSTGRKPGKKQTKEIKEEVVLTLLPTALTRRSTTNLWLDLERSTLTVDASSESRADDAITLLVRSLQGLSVSHQATELSPSVAMANWLTTGEPPEQFTVDRECELKSRDEMKSVVRYGRHSLDTNEVRAHVNAGKLPTRLAMTWRGRVSFVLADSGALRKVSFLDGVFEGKSTEADAWDADAAIYTGELRALVADLTEAMGGLVDPAGDMPTPPQVKPDTFIGDGSADPLLAQARALVVEHKRPSISLVQRYLRIGYNRAARLLEALEADGVVSAMHSNGQRDLLATV
jgi:recombination associated protein RdgC